MPIKTGHLLINNWPIISLHVSYPSLHVSYPSPTPSLSFTDSKRQLLHHVFPLFPVPIPFCLHSALALETIAPWLHTLRMPLSFPSSNSCRVFWSWGRTFNFSRQLASMNESLPIWRRRKAFFGVSGNMSGKDQGSPWTSQSPHPLS
jgi:hypothetical protein